MRPARLSETACSFCGGGRVRVLLRTTSRIWVRSIWGKAFQVGMEMTRGKSNCAIVEMPERNSAVAVGTLQDPAAWDTLL